MNRDSIRRGLLAPLLTMLILLVSVAAAQASTITVTRTDDPIGDQNCLGADTSCSLRQAVDAENGTSAGGDTIVLASGTYSLTQGTDIIATKSFDLQGAGIASTTIDGSKNASSAAFNPLARILRVDSGATAVIQGITFTGGFDEQDEGCSSACSTINSWGGGDLLNHGGTVVLDGVAFADNYSSATPLGGAVSNYSGSLTMNNVSFTHNAAGAGGALFTRSGTVSGNGVTFSGNATTCCAGSAAYLLGGTISLVNTTIANSGGFDGGGAIANGGANLTLDNVTLANDGADIQTDQGAATTVENTILATNAGGTACVPVGRGDGLNNQTSGPAITGDLGNNIAQDNSCGLQAAGDKSNVDPRLVPLFDNGGPTQTEALLDGSPALGDPATANCPPKDQRGISRPSGKCDIGAFEAVINGAPAIPSADAAQNITDTSADLGGTIDLNGEAGGFHFVYGTSRADLSNRTDEVAAGVAPPDTAVTQTLSNLTPDTTYYYSIVADNASDSKSSENVLSFTTQAGPPAIGNDISVDSITDTTATVHFSIDPQGSDTTYYVKYGANTDYGQQTDPVDIGSAPGAQQLSANLTGLAPNSTVHFDIVASNGVQQNVDSGDHTVGTFQGITGTAGQPVTLTDTGDAFKCPAQDRTPIGWGDGSSDTGAQFQCSADGEDGQNFQLSDRHIYAAPGTYKIVITYSELGYETDVFAHIAANPGAGGSPSPGSLSPGPQPTTTPPSSPTVGAANAQTVTVTGAGFSGVVTPNGLPTRAHFEYGLDPKYSGGGAIVYDHSTPDRPVGSDFASHDVGPVAIGGLLPNALYHVRLVAVNSSGTTFGPDATFTTAAAPAPSPPTLGKTVNVTPVSGFVLIKINGNFVPLTGAEQIPFGSQIDARHGSLELITSTGQKGKLQHGTFGGAIFKLTQAHSGLVTLKLVEGAFKGAPSYALCKAHKAADATIASTKTLQLLKASAHGKFRTSGRYSAATVRGTIWTVADRCDGTLTHVITDSVAVTDFVHHKTIILHAGQSYLARPRKTA